MYTKITLVELADLIAQSTSTTKRVCELFVRELFATISQALIDGETVKVKGIGTFSVTTVKSRKSVSISTGDAIEVAGYKKLNFVPSDALAKAVNHAFAQFETITINDALTDDKLAEIDQQYPSLFNEEGERVETPAMEPDSAEHTEAAPAQETEPAPVDDEPQTMTADAATQEGQQEGPEKPVEEEIPVEAVGQKALEAFGVHIQPSVQGPSRTEAPQEVEPAHTEPVQTESSREAAVAEPASEPDDGFRRPAPRNAYTPTQEQIERSRHSHQKRHWLWALPAAVVAGLIIWLVAKPGSGNSDAAEGTGAVPADTIVAEAEPEVITDRVTDKVVLTTLADKYYGSQWFWVYIYEENKAIISDPNNMEPGTEVVIPPAEKYGIDADDPASIKKAQYRSWEIVSGKYKP